MIRKRLPVALVAMPATELVWVLEDVLHLVALCRAELAQRVARGISRSKDADAQGGSKARLVIDQSEGFACFLTFCAVVS